MDGDSKCDAVQTRSTEGRTAPGKLMAVPTLGWGVQSKALDGGVRLGGPSLHLVKLVGLLMLAVKWSIPWNTSLQNMCT